MDCDDRHKSITERASHLPQSSSASCFTRSAGLADPVVAADGHLCSTAAARSIASVSSTRLSELIHVVFVRLTPRRAGCSRSTTARPV